MKGLKVSEETFEEQLVYDEIFVDYFNAFLSLPAFPKALQYDQFSGTIKELDCEQENEMPGDAIKNSESKEKVMQWVKKERLPLFLRTQLYQEYKLCRLLIRKLSNRSTVPSSRGLRGYSRATSFTNYSLATATNRPSSHVSNSSWPVVPVQQFGRRPLGSASSLPGMLRLGLSPDNPDAFHLSDLGFGNVEFQNLDLANGEMVEREPLEANERPEVQENVKSNSKLNGDSQQKEEKTGKTQMNGNRENIEGRLSRSSLRPEGRRSPSKTVEIRDGVEELVKKGSFFEEEDADDLVEQQELSDAERDMVAVVDFGEDDSEDAQTDAEVQSIVDQHQLTLQDLKQQTIGSVRGMYVFQTFLQDTLGIHLYNFWLDAERYKDSLESEPEETLRKHRTKLFREMQDKYKNYLTPDAKEQIERAVQDAGGLTQDLFTRTQYDVLRRLRSYWIPRFLVHLERNQDFVENTLLFIGQSRPPSNLSFIPSFSIVHSLPPLGDWCRELVRENTWNRDMLIKVARNKSARWKNLLSRSDKEEEQDQFIQALKVENKAGCPFRQYLERTENKSLLYNLMFWLDATNFHASGKRLGDRYLRLCQAWEIFNKYIGVGSVMNIGEGALEQRRLECALKSNNELSLDVFKLTQVSTVKRLRPTWLEFCKFEISSFKTNPGSSPSERQHRLHTALAIAEDIDTDRGTGSHGSPSPKRPATKLSPQEKIKERGKSRTKKAPKQPKNVKIKQITKDTDESESESGSDSEGAGDATPNQSEMEKTQDLEKPKMPEFLDVVDDKGTMSAFKLYLQNHEGRHTYNRLTMYLEVESYNTILPTKKLQKSQQSNLIYRTYFDPYSRRSVGLPPVILEKVEAERPSSPILTEAQEFIRADLESSFDNFSKHLTTGGAKEVTQTPTTPGQVSKGDTFDSGTSILQFYKKKTKKTKTTGRMQPNKQDRDSFRKVLQSVHGRLSVKLEYFRRYLQQHSHPDGETKLENDLLFYLEVQKLKELFNFMDDVSLSKKVDTIVECFLDSATPPWLQIDIGPDLAARIIHKSQVFALNRKIPRDQKDPSIFDEAQSILFKELLPYWAGFCKHYRPPSNEQDVRLPPTKQEKIHRKRYAEFLKFPDHTTAVMLPALAPCYGYSRSELSFSMADGAKWKAIKEKDTASVISSIRTATNVRKHSVIAEEKSLSELSVSS